MANKTKKLLLVITPGVATLIWVLAMHGNFSGDQGNLASPHTSGAAVLKRGPSRRNIDKPSDERTIFVNIAAFRDNEAQETLRDMRKKAKNFTRIHIGIVCQRDIKSDDEICIPPEWSASDIEKFNITLEDMDAQQAKGPTYARHRASLMYKGEDYFMMIDSHNKFVTHWDELIIKHHDVCTSEKCVLSVYPMATQPGVQNYDSKPYVAHLCGNAMWHGHGYPGPFSGAVYEVVKNTNRPQPYVGAGLVFTHGSMVHEVPFDPHLPFLFHGEEILMTVRLWTHGYDFFSPGDNILYHHYYRSGKPRMETLPSWATHQSRSARRVQYLLELPDPRNPSRTIVPRDTKEAYVTVEAEKYGLGTERSVQQYWRFAGIDIAKRSHEEANKYWCHTYNGRPPYTDDWVKRITTK